MAQVTPRAPREQQRSSRPQTTSSPSGRRSPKPRRPSIVGRVIGLILLGLMGLGFGYFIGGSKVVRDYGWAGVKTIFHPPTAADLFPGKQSINLLIIGRDYDYTDQDQIIHKTLGRSDMLMVAHLDFNTNTAHLLSIPRDTRADVPGKGVHKINAAHEFGGPPLVEQTIQSNFGIPSDQYISIDFVGFEKAIDEMGGVDLAVDRKMDYDDNWGHLHIHLKPGQQHLSGNQAMGFVRFRHADSDFVRVQRQQTLLAALKEKLTSPMILAKLPEILDTLNNHIDSDLSVDQKVFLAKYLHGLPKDKIAMDTLPSLDGAGNLVQTDWTKATPMIQHVFGVTPPEGDAPAGGRVHRRHRRHFRPA